MKGKSLGWIILLGALAVPAVLFFKWWSQMKATQTAEARQGVPAAAPFPGGGQPASAPSQPPPAAPAPAAGEPAASAPAQAPAELPSGTATAQAAEPAPSAPSPAPQAQSMVPPVTVAPGGVPAPPASPEGDGSSPAPRPGVPTIEYAPKTQRDPTLSVADQRELLKRKMAAQIAQQEVQKAAEEPAAPPPPPPKPLCDHFELQGIVGTGGDLAAIINDRVVHEGDTIGGAVIERLTTRTVVFKKGKKTCMKRVSK